ncbi:MAG TPA: LptF/LptG family permease [Anaeromyxobacteraceae bacterium]|jgi:lipopolysaccharide export system permease protein|nr:LptF/LptG family permease [Anaeromyxobacteraceae bacterium]
MTLFLHLARRAAVAFLAALAAVVALFLVVDFAENASAFRGPGWVPAVLELYANRSGVVAWQVAPAAMVLAAAVTASGLRRTREWTAMRALGLGPWRLALPVLAVALAAAAVFVAFGDTLVTRAGQRADAIMVERFHRGGFGRSQEPRRWFRGRDGRRIYHLRGGAGSAFERVTILEVTPEFRLARRIDAERMEPGPAEGEWLLSGVAERAFARDGGMVLASYPQRAYRFDEEPGAFAVRPGRPSQLPRALLGQQTALRRRLGLPFADFALEWHDRLAHPFAALSAGLVALALALRRERKGHLTAAIVEAVGVSLAFWAVQGIFWSLGVASRLPPLAAAWAAPALFLAAGAWLLRRNA